MRNMDYNRFQRFCTIINRIQANLNFTQSLSDYFATDEMLEPALLVISEAIRRNLNLGASLRGGSVAGNALLYRHRASSRDREFSTDSSHYRERNEQNSRKTFATSTQRVKHEFQSNKYPLVSCWVFQENGEC